MSNSNPLKYYLPLILGYCSLSVLTYFILYYFGFVEHLPDSSTLKSGDAGFYFSIKEKGYEYSTEHAGNVGFFPLFAYWWRFTHLGFVGISILNGLIFLFSLSWLCSFLKPDKILLGFFMASPYMIFMYVPLSESIFFLFCVGILYGLINENWKYVFFGVFLASMTRATFLFFIPAFVGMTLMSQPINKILNWTTWKKILGTYLLPCLLGVSAVILFQYFQTGKWFAYFEVQSRVWGRSFHWPVLPFGYNTPYWNLNGSYISFWIGMFIALIGLKLLLDWFRKKDILRQVKNYELFSIIFICMSLVSIVFFNAIWMWNPELGYSSTHFTGINRYIHPSVFFLILITYFFRINKLSAVQYLGIFIFSNLVWFCFDLEYFKHIQRYLVFGIPMIVITALGLYHAFRWKILGYALIIASLVLQSFLYSYFLGHVQLD